MKVCLFKGEAEGIDKITAYDNATLMAGIGNFNIIKVTSIVEKDTKVMGKLPEFKPGTMVKAVLNRMCSDKPDDVLAVGVGVAIGKEFGVVCEVANHDKSYKQTEKELNDALKYMMKQRGMKIEAMYTTCMVHKVKEHGSVVAGLVYF